MLLACSTSPILYQRVGNFSAQSGPFLGGVGMDEGQQKGTSDIHVLGGGRSYILLSKLCLCWGGGGGQKESDP